MPESDVRHCTVEDTGMTVAGEGAAPFVEALNEYLKMFAATRDKDGYMHCHNCGENLDGLLGSFRWGMAHGEGFCSNCKWPAVGLHYPEKDGEKMFNRAWKVCLSVHPDYVSWGGGEGAMTIEREDDIMADVMGIPRDDGAVEPVYGRDGDRFREAPKKWWEYPDNVAQLGRAFVSWGWSAEDLQAYYEAPYRWSETWEGMSNAQQRKHFIGGEGVLPSTVEDQAAGQG